ncbi:MAG: hypothetical protein KDC92_17555, partial [Bacteroidetes bacterium]|nr:hypothetical protein [Bacteroidota bacterium]
NQKDQESLAKSSVPLKSNSGKTENQNFKPLTSSSYNNLNGNNHSQLSQANNDKADAALLLALNSSCLRGEYQPMFLRGLDYPILEPTALAEMSDIPVLADEFVTDPEKKKKATSEDIALFSLSSGYNDFNFRSAQNGDLASLNNKIYRGGWYNSFRAKFGFQLKDNLMLTTGVGLMQATNQTRFSLSINGREDDPNISYKKLPYVNPQERNGILSIEKEEDMALPNNENSDQEIIVGDNFRVFSQFTWIEIPVGFRYAKAARNKWTLITEFGLSGRLLLNSNSYLPTFSQSDLVEIGANFSNSVYRPVLDTYLGTGVSYQLFNSLELGIIVEHFRSMNSLARPSQYMQMYPQNTGIKLSVVQRM